MRIRRLCLATLGGALVAVCPAQPARTGPDWPCFRGHAENTGVAPVALPAELRVRWRSDLGDPVSATAAIAGGLVFIGDEAGEFVALELESGTVRWRYKAADAIASSAAVLRPSPPVVGACTTSPAGPSTAPVPAAAQVVSAPAEAPPAAALVVVGDDSGMLHALDAETGAVRWTFKTDGRIVSSPNFAPPPTRAAATRPAGVPDAQPATSTAPQPAVGAARVPLGACVVFGSYDGGVYCVQAADGRRLWRYDVHERVHATPTIVGEQVLVAGCDANLHVIGLADGIGVRTIALPGVSGSAAAVRGELAFIGTYSEKVVAVDWRAGRVAWVFEDTERAFPFLSSAAVAGPRVLIGGHDKRLRCLAAASGRQQWQFATRGRVESSPVVVPRVPGHAAGGDEAGWVFVGSADGNLYAVDVETGREMWRFEAGGPISASPAVAAGCLVIGTESGVVYCLGGP